MRWLNNTVKFFGLLGVHLLTFVRSYIMSLVFSSPIICVALVIISVVYKGFPKVINERFWLFYIVMAVPLSIVFFILIETDVVKLFKKDIY